MTDPSFQGLNRFFVLSFENEADKRRLSGYYTPISWLIGEIVLINILEMI